MNYFQNINIDKMYCRSEFTHNMNSNHEGHYLKCRIIGVTSYPREVLGFTALFEDGAIYAGLPAHAFSAVTATSPFDFRDLIYENCGEGPIIIYKIEGITNVQSYFKRLNTWELGKYLYSVEWLTDNKLLNIILLSTGELVLLPYHKILVGDNRIFPTFQKLCQSWIV